MARTEPIKKYIAAINAFQKGDKKTAADLLAKSLGDTKPNHALENNLDQLLSSDSPANEVTLIILASEVGKSERRY